MVTRAFVRTIGIDYSGMKTPTARLSELAVYRADGNAEPQEVDSPAVAARRWTRRELAEWLVEQLRGNRKPTLVGIDHAFSFPICYFRRHTTSTNKAGITSLRISRGTGQPMETARGWVKSVRTRAGVAPVSTTGAGQQIGMSLEPKPYFKAKAKAKWHTPPTPVFPGCCTSGGNWGETSTSGLSTDGKSLRVNPLLRKYTHHSGITGSVLRVETNINVTPTALRGGFRTRTRMATYPPFSIPVSHKPSAAWQCWRVGYWV